MKNIISICIILCLSGCFGKRPSLDTGHEGQLIPSMNLLLLDSSTRIDIKTWRTGKPLVLIDISPYCPYCRAVTQNIIDDNNKLSNIQFIFLSSFALSDLKNYSAPYRLNNYSNIIFARDDNMSFGRYFNSPGVPCIAIYGKDRLLRQVLMGNVNASLIKDIALD